MLYEVITLPFLTMQIPAVGSMLLPMHIPVLLCGFFCGWRYGLIVGVVAPLLRSVLFGMPPMFPTAAAMAFELAAYGALTGLLFQRFPKKAGYIYATMLISMIRITSYNVCYTKLLRFSHKTIHHLKRQHQESFCRCFSILRYCYPY